jgi:ketosteroid isomerase-like protein
MNRIMQIIVALMFIVGGAFSAFAQSNNGKIAEQILKLENELLEATKKMSAEDIDRLYATNFMVTARIPPRVFTKAEIVARREDTSAPRGTIESLTNSDVKVRVYGDATAIVTGAWKRIAKHADGKDASLSGRFTHVWIKQNGKWLVAGAHYSPDIDLEKLKAAQTEGKKN